MIEGTSSFTIHSFLKPSPSPIPMLDGMLGSSLVFFSTFANLLVDKIMIKIKMLMSQSKIFAT